MSRAMKTAREAFTEYVEREYQTNDGLQWADGVPFIDQDDRRELLEEEWLCAQAMFAAGVRASAEVEVK